uniref:Nucleotide-diphospho-sugar transferase domain-containing protein n=1 Tax=viral metagenome TaxID=1070528 RepID=A0A6C0HIQ9_9ZZZZ
MEEQLKEYVEKHKPNISIFTVCPAGSCPVEFTNSLVGTMQLCFQFKITIQVEFHKQYHTLVHAKNAFLSKCERDKSITHIMFIDSNVVWKPTDILGMLLKNKPIIAGAVPQSYSWDAFDAESNIFDVISNKRKSETMLDNIPLSALLKSKICRYNVQIPSNDIVIDNNLLEVLNVSFQFVMIQREVIEKMAVSFPSSKYISNNTAMCCFMENTVENGVFYSDEEVFARRWSNMNGKIYIGTNIILENMNLFSCQGDLLRSLLLM